MPIINGTTYHASTPSDVIAILEDARRTNKRIRVYYGDKKTGEIWPELAMRGTIKRSMGPTKVPLLVKTSRSYGGESILDHCIVKIETSPYKSVLYAHPNVKVHNGRE